MQYKFADYVLTNFLFFFSGIKICGGCSRDGREVNGIFIKRILPGGLADQDGNFFSIPNVQIKFWFTVDIMFICLFEQSISLSPSIFKE